ncbi:MAG: hypothetical protein HYX60_12055 [Legionella longbeachae]|nr:hypothetical protein [Legionella longbeachae]
MYSKRSKNPIKLNSILFYILIFFLNLSNAASVSITSPSNRLQKQINDLSNIIKKGTKVSTNLLPSPFDYLLTQPLMTIGIEKYYKRTPIIQTIYASRNQHNATYSRVIIMFIDGNKKRNNAKRALEIKEAVPVELAFITFNFEELPKDIKLDILNTNIPFGKLLVTHHLKTSYRDRIYFSVECNNFLAPLVHCNLNSKLYGRTNTIVRTDNKKWIAHIVEILPLANGK